MSAAALALLTGPEVEDLLGAALDARGEELASWRLRSVHHRPGGTTTASYVALARTPAGEVSRTLAASTAAVPAARDGVLTVPVGGTTVTVWPWQEDPWLPALAAACDGPAVRAQLAELGVAAHDVRLRVRGYRPRRRAVVEVTAADRTLFLKVLRPGAVEATHDRHRLLRDAGVPVPASLGRTRDGLLVLTALPGTPLRSRLQERGGDVPDGAALLALLDRLPDGVRALPHRRSWTDAVDHYARVVGDALPEQAERSRQLADGVAALTAGAPAVDATHGDLYEAQLLVDGPRVCGVLDVDTAGPGRRADDLACLLAHAHVLAMVQPDHAASTARTARGWQDAFERTVDPVELRARVAGVAVSLATGPHRVQEQGWQAATLARLDLAEQWLASAR